LKDEVDVDLLGYNSFGDLRKFVVDVVSLVAGVDANIATTHATLLPSLRGYKMHL
jgi:hypothetical protein